MSANTSDQGPPPTTQAKESRQGWGIEFLRQMPHLRFSRTRDDNYMLIREDAARAELQGLPQDIIDEVIADMKSIDHDVMRLFRDRDYDAAQNQNTYRLYQVSYMVLATAATFVGSLQAVLFGADPRWVALFAFIQTVLAGLTTFLSFITTREPPLPLWMENRRQAEFLRREAFRYLIGLPPYNDDKMKRHERKRRAAERAAQVNKGAYPEEEF